MFASINHPPDATYQALPRLHQSDPAEELRPARTITHGDSPALSLQRFCGRVIKTPPPLSTAGFAHNLLRKLAAVCAAKT